MPRPRDEGAQIASLSESLRRSATISIALTILTVLTIIGVSVYLYRRGRHPKTHYAPLNSSIELLPIASSRSSVETTTTSRQGKRRIAAVFARKARRVFAKGRLAPFSGRRWGRKSKKVVHWDLPEDDHQDYSDVDEDENTRGPQVSQSQLPAHESHGLTNPQSLIDLTITGEGDIGDLSQRSTFPLVDLEEARRPPWLGTSALTPSSSTSSNPTPYPSQDLVDLSVMNETSGPFTRPKPALRPFTLLVPSTPLELASPSPKSETAFTVAKCPNQGLESVNVWANIHLTPISPALANSVNSGHIASILQETHGHTQSGPNYTEKQGYSLPHAVETPEIAALVDDKAASLLHALSSPIHGSQPVSPVASPTEGKSHADLGKPDQCGSLAEGSPFSSQSSLSDDNQHTSQTSSASHSPPAATLKALDELELSCYPLSDDVAIPSPAPSTQEVALARALVISNGLDTNNRSSPPVSPHYFASLHPPEPVSRLLTPEYTPLVVPGDESEKVPELEMQKEPEEPHPSISPVPLLQTLPTFHSDDTHDNFDDLDENPGDDRFSVYPDPELANLPDVPSDCLSKRTETEGLLMQNAVEEGLCVILNEEVPQISISIPDATECVEDPDLPVIMHSPIVRLTPPTQTPTPPPSPPSQLSPLSSSPHPRLSPLQNRDNNEALLASPLRPAWSLRASDAPALGLAPPKPSQVAVVMRSPAVEATQSLPGSFEIEENEGETKSVIAPLVTPNADLVKSQPVVDYRPPRLRNLRSPVDIALAMQLRPGLGLGADPAWMVRFLMAMFGWLAVLVGNHGDF